jgi:hypothetical protein
MGEKDDEVPLHKRRVLVRPRLFLALEAYAAERDSDTAAELNRAVLEMLQREGRWPPREEPAAGKKAG